MTCLLDPIGYLCSKLSSGASLSGPVPPIGTCVHIESDLEDLVINEMEERGPYRLSHDELIGLAPQFEEGVGFGLLFYDEKGAPSSAKYSVIESFKVQQKDDQKDGQEGNQKGARYAWTGIWDIMDCCHRNTQIIFGPIETKAVLTDGKPYTQFPGARHFQLCLHTICLDLLNATFHNGAIKLFEGLEDLFEKSDNAWDP